MWRKAVLLVISFISMLSIPLSGTGSENLNTPVETSGLSINGLLDFGAYKKTISLKVTNSDKTSNNFSLSSESKSLSFSKLSGKINGQGTISIDAILDRKNLPAGNNKFIVTIAWKTNKKQYKIRSYTQDNSPIWPNPNGYQNALTPSASNIDPEKLTKLWDFKLFDKVDDHLYDPRNELGYSVIAQNKVYIAKKGKIWCFDLTSGKKTWERNNVTGEKLFWLNGKIITGINECFDAQDGTVVAAPRINDIRFVLDGRIYTSNACYNDTFEKVWSGSLISTTVTNGKILGFNQDRLYCVNAATGKTIWTKTEKKKDYYGYLETGATRDIFVFIGNQNILKAVNANNGILIWEKKLEEYSGWLKFCANGKIVIQMPTRGGEFLMDQYAASNRFWGDESVYFLDASDGKFLYYYQGLYLPALAKDNFFTTNGSMFCGDIVGKKLVRRFPNVPDGVIAIAGDKLCVIGVDGYLQCWSSGLGLLPDRELADFGVCLPKKTHTLDVGFENLGTTKITGQVSIVMPYAWLPQKDIIFEPGKATTVKINLNLTNFKGDLARSLDGSLKIKHGDLETTLPIRAFVDDPKPPPDCLSQFDLKAWEDFSQSGCNTLEPGLYMESHTFENAYVTKGEIVSVTDGRITILDPKTMAETASFAMPVNDVRNAFPDINGNAILTTKSDASIYKIEKTSGKVLWKTTIESVNRYSVGQIIPYSQRIYCIQYWRIICLEALSGRILWSFNFDPIPQNDYQSDMPDDRIFDIVEIDGSVYFPVIQIDCFDLFKLEAASGKVLQKKRLLTGVSNADSMIANPQFYVYRDRMFLKHCSHTPFWYGKATNSLFCFDFNFNLRYKLEDLLLDGLRIFNGLLSVFNGEVHESDTGKLVVKSSKDGYASKMGDLIFNGVGFCDQNGKKLNTYKIAHASIGHEVRVKNIGGRIFLLFDKIDSSFLRSYFDSKKISIQVYSLAPKSAKLEIGSKNIIAGGKVVQLSQAPQMKDGKVFIPIDLFSVFGAHTNIDCISFCQQFISFEANKSTYSTFDRRCQISIDDKDPNLKTFNAGETMMIPLDFICRFFGVDCSKDPKTGSFTIVAWR